MGLVGRAMAGVNLGAVTPVQALAAIQAEIVDCRTCPRLVAWREQVAARSGPRSATRTTGAARCPGSAIPTPAWSSWGWRLPPTAPTAPGACSPATGRGTSCTPRCTAPGSRTSPRATRATTASQLSGACITAPVRCAPPANKPTVEERDACRPYLERERALLDGAGLRRARRLRLRGASAGPRRARRGRRSATASRSPLGDGRSIVGCFHVSQQNTFTGQLTEPMLDVLRVLASPASQGACPELSQPRPVRPATPRRSEAIAAGSRRPARRARISPVA